MRPQADQEMQNETIVEKDDNENLQWLITILKFILSMYGLFVLSRITSEEIGDEIYNEG